MLLCAALVGTTLPAAAATESARAANTLYELGLFQGVGTDNFGRPMFDLERTPTRTEALVMLVRLLGKEQEAKAGAYQHPFSDVDAWADAYVGYAYECGLTTGTSTITFGGVSPADGNTYATFVLRALGYVDNADEPDFTYGLAVDFARRVGLIEGDYSEGFSRGDVAELSLSALTQPIKGESASLIGRLAAEGAVDRAMAERAGLLAAVEFDGTKMLAPCVYDEKGSCELTPATVLSLLPDCRYVLSYFGWSEKPLTVRERFLTALGVGLYDVYSEDRHTPLALDSYSVVTPKNKADATTYTFFVDKDYNILAYLDSTMLTPSKSTVPLETKVKLDGAAIARDVKAKMVEKLGRWREERFTISERGYEGEYPMTDDDGNAVLLYPIVGESVGEVAYVARNYIPAGETDETVRGWVRVGVFDALYLHPENLSPPDKVADPDAPGEYGVTVWAGARDSMLLVTLYDADKVCLGYALYHW